MNPICDVVVLTWNKLEITKHFISSFLANTFVPTRLIIVDNASSDGTRDYILSLKSKANCEFKVVLNDKNEGYAGGMNQGIDISRAPYVCLANNDILLTEGWLGEMISVFEKHKEVGLLNPASNTLGVYSPRGVSLDEFGKRIRDERKGVFAEMPYCTGFCILIKREVIDRIGGLSREFYPMFFEDGDYSMRVKRAGYLIGQAKGSYVWHQEHASFALWERKKDEEVFGRSRSIFIKKWGKTLRVAWIVNSYQELLENLKEAVELSRKGSYVWFLVKDFSQKREKVFQAAGIFEHSGINFIKANNNINLLWRIFVKKKKYDLVIDNNRFRRRFIRHYNLGNDFGRYKVFANFDREKIERIRYSCD